MKKLNQKAFTIIELLIASMVFTAVLLLCLEGITRIAKAYIKNSSISETSEFIKTLNEEITQQIKYGPSIYPIIYETDKITKMCFNGKAYRIELNLKSPDSVKRKNDQTCSGYDQAFFFTTADTESLAPIGLRVLNFSINPDGDAYSVLIRVALGDADLLEDVGGVSLTDPLADFKTARCKSGISGSEYCAVTGLSTLVTRRMANQL